MNVEAWKNTDNYNQYLSYLGIRESWKYSYKGINIVDALSSEIISLYVAGANPDWYHVGCELLKRVDPTNLRRAFSMATTICTFNATIRKDHREMSHLVQSSINDSVWVEIAYKYRPWGVLPLVIKEYFAVAKRLQLSFKKRCYLAACIVAYKKNVDVLSDSFQDVDLRGRKLVPFSATTYYESLLTLFFKTKGVVTYTTFHGILGHYRQHITNDVVLGLNIQSDYALAFSKDQKADLETHFGIIAERIYVAGNPKYPYREITYDKLGKKCLILSGVSYYDDDIKKLLPIADEVGREMGITFSIKPHPSSMISEEYIVQYPHLEIIEKSQTIRQLLSSNEYKVAITHNTTAYFECLYYGVRPLRWGINENLDFKMLDEIFTSKEQLRQYLSITPDNGYTQSAQQLLTDVLGMGVNRYNEIINKR